MATDYNEKIEHLLGTPEKLLLKKPFVRGTKPFSLKKRKDTINVNNLIKPLLPSFRYEIVTQEDYMNELDPYSHRILYDDNVPSITMKLTEEQGGGFYEIESKKMALPYQRNIKNKQVLHLAGNPTEFTLMETNPSDAVKNNFIVFKQYWNNRNQDGMRMKFIDAQKSFGDAALLYYFDRHKKIKCRLISFPNYVIIPINDENGDRLLESIYYNDEEGNERIDTYDDTTVYHYIRDGLSTSGTDNGFRLINAEAHGFTEIPVVSKRGKVAWEDAQTIIEVYEILFNIFNVIQKRHGWGILYIKGQISEKAKKLAGNIILADRTLDGKGSAEFKSPPSPQGYIETLDRLRDEIQTASRTTFLLPKDIKMSGDISGIAIQLTQSGDNENATLAATDWQNALDKMVRLFKFGLAKELVQNEQNATAITDFSSLRIKATLKVWMPKSLSDVVNRVCTLVSANVISKQTATSIIEGINMATPDEDMRLEREAKEAVLLEQKRNTETIDVE